MKNIQLKAMAKYAITILTILVFGIIGFLIVNNRIISRKSTDYNEIPVKEINYFIAEERNISNILVLDAYVVANPIFRITAPIDGVLVKLNDDSVGIQDPKSEVVSTIDLPASSKIERFLVTPGTKVTEGLPILNARYVGFALQATVESNRIYRLIEGILSARGQITNGPGPFESSLLGTPFVLGSGSIYEEQGEAGGSDNFDNTTRNFFLGGDIQITDSSQGVVVITAIPKDLVLLEGLPGLLALTLSEVEKAVVLPIEAVAGISQKGQVYVDDNGERVLREVSIGITDGSYVQITRGLTPGEKVLLPSPSIENLK